MPADPEGLTEAADLNSEHGRCHTGLSTRDSAVNERDESPVLSSGSRACRLQLGGDTP